MLSPDAINLLSGLPEITVEALQKLGADMLFSEIFNKYASLPYKAIDIGSPGSNPNYDSSTGRITIPSE